MIAKTLRLYERKWHYLYNLFGKKKGRLSLQSSLERLKMSVASQMRLLKKLEKARGQGQLIKDLEKALEQQKKLFSRANITDIISKGYAGTISAMEGEAISLLNKEQMLLLKLEKELPSAGEKRKAFRLGRTQAKQAAKVIFTVNKYIRALSDAVGSRAEVQKAAKLLLKELARLQHTEVYGYVKDDAEKIKQAAKVILANPREAKLRQMLAGIYLVAPFSFDATGAVIFLRYAAKYANAKSKGLQKKIKAIREKRKRHLKIF
ncbi:MAG TPA: hypothetical protein HA362_03805 [Nanoarchaeota archaeon]|nr:hypothetical protein [Nanoarchaeota archaeon]